jgi:hypothetical protein
MLIRKVLPCPRCRSRSTWESDEGALRVGARRNRRCYLGPRSRARALLPLAQEWPNRSPTRWMRQIRGLQAVWWTCGLLGSEIADGRRTRFWGQGRESCSGAATKTRRRGAFASANLGGARRPRPGRSLRGRVAVPRKVELARVDGRGVVLPHQEDAERGGVCVSRKGGEVAVSTKLVLARVGGGASSLYISAVRSGHGVRRPGLSDHAWRLPPLERISGTWRPHVQGEALLSTLTAAGTAEGEPPTSLAVQIRAELDAMRAVAALRRLAQRRLTVRPLAVAFEPTRPRIHARGRA